MHLDAALAAGAAPAAGTLLGTRAVQLGELSSRWRLAGDLERLMKVAETADGRWRARPLSDRLTAVGCEIEQLIAALYSFDAVNPRGVAMARLLIRDGTGPVYNPRSERRLQDAVEDCLAALHSDCAASRPRSGSAHG